MQTIHKNKNEGSSSEEIDPIDPVICTGRISRCIKGKHSGKLRRRTIRIQIGRRVLSRHKEEI